MSDASELSADLKLSAGTVQNESPLSKSAVTADRPAAVKTKAAKKKSKGNVEADHPVPAHMASRYRAPASVRIGTQVVRAKDGQRAKIDRLLVKLEKAIDRGEISSFEKGDIYNALRTEYKQTYKRTMTLSTLAHQLRIGRSPQRLSQVGQTAAYYPTEIRDASIPFKHYERARLLNLKLGDEAKTPAEIVDALRTVRDPTHIAVALGLKPNQHHPPMSLTFRSRFNREGEIEVTYKDKRPPGEHPREQLAQMRALLGDLYVEFVAYLAARMIEGAHENSDEASPLGLARLNALHEGVCDRTRQILCDEHISSRPGDVEYVVGVLTSGLASNEDPVEGAVHQKSTSMGNATNAKSK